MTDAQLKFLHRWIDLDALYRQPLPVRKISVPPGTEGPRNKFPKFFFELSVTFFPEFNSS